MGRILVDADACPVKEIIINISNSLNLDVILFSNYNHVMNYDVHEIVCVDATKEAADFKIMSYAKPNDIVVTGDYGLASMLLPKECHIIHPNGFIYTNDNIDALLLSRHIGKQQRKNNKFSRGGGPKKRTSTNDTNFYDSFFNLCSTTQKI